MVENYVRRDDTTNVFVDKLPRGFSKTYHALNVDCGDARNDYRIILPLSLLLQDPFAHTSILVYELLKDFEDSGSQGEAEQQHLFISDERLLLLRIYGRAKVQNSSMVLDREEEDGNKDQKVVAAET